MARLNIYIMLTAAGPDRATQEKAIRDVVDVGEMDQWYVDDLSVRKRKKDHRFPMRMSLLRHMRADDSMVVAYPGMLGIGKEDILSVLRALGAKGNNLIVAKVGKDPETFVWTEDRDKAFAFVDRAISEYKQIIAANARAHRRTGAEAYVPKPKKLKVTDAQARQAWHDLDGYTAEEVSELCGVSIRALHYRFGGRRGAAALEGKKP